MSGRSRLPWVLGGLLAIAVLIGALVVSTAGSGGSDPGPVASLTASPSPSPSPTSTLSPEEQQAVEEAAAVVLKSQQLYYDLLADPSRLNELNAVLAEPQLSIDLPNLQYLASTGTTTVESTGPVELASVEPLSVDLTGAPPTVTLLVCVDNTAASGTTDGEPWSGNRKLAQYRVVQTTYLPAPGWALAQVLPPPGYEQTQTC